MLIIDPSTTNPYDRGIMSISARRRQSAPMLKRWREGIPTTSGFSASASYSGEGPEKAMDNNLSATSGWTSSDATLPQWWQVQYASAWKPVTYELWSRTGVWWRTPTAWTLSGSNNGTTWTTVDSRSNVSWVDDSPPSHMYQIANPASFSYWRITITATASGTDVPGFQEIALYSGSTNDIPPPQVTAPTQAAGIGYTSLKFSDDFDSISTIDFTGNAVAGQGYKWTALNPFDGNFVSTSSNTTISNSVLTLRQTTDNYNLALFTTNRGTGSHLAGPFQYGYFEAKMKFDASQVVSGGYGWPSFWSIGATHVLLQNDTRWPELDFFEFAKDTSKPSGGVFAGSIHDHDKRTGTEIRHGNDGYNTVNVNPATWNDWHVYGCLWQPGSIKWYFDNTLVITQLYTATSQNPAAGNGNPPGAYAQLDDSTHGPATIMLGTGKDCPIQIDWVRIWQAP